MKNGRRLDVAADLRTRMQAATESSDREVRDVVAAIEGLLQDHAMVCEACVIIQGANVRTQVVFRKREPGDVAATEPPR